MRLFITIASVLGMFFVGFRQGVEARSGTLSNLLLEPTVLQPPAAKSAWPFRYSHREETIREESEEADESEGRLMN